jgi:hypothetical protein
MMKNAVGIATKSTEHAHMNQLVARCSHKLHDILETNQRFLLAANLLPKRRFLKQSLVIHVFMSIDVRVQVNSVNDVCATNDAVKCFQSVLPFSFDENISFFILRWFEEKFGIFLRKLRL